MTRPVKIAILAATITLLVAQLAISATFQSSSATLIKGENVGTSPGKNGNRTTFTFSDTTTNPATSKPAAFLQWAPLGRRAGDYKNGILVDKDKTVRLWINGIWFTVAFDGQTVTVR